MNPYTNLFTKDKTEQQKDERSCWVRVFPPDYSAKKEGRGLTHAGGFQDVL